MPIEFRCSKCDRLLRTPDGTSGKDAKCPQCGTIVRIPEVSAPPTAPAPSPQRAPVPPGLRDTLAVGETPNPYQSPTAGEMRAGAAGPVRRGFEPTRIDLGEVLGKTWRIYTANLWLCVLVALPLVVLGNGQNAYIFARGGKLNPAENLAGLFLSIAAFWLTLGMITAMLKIARGEKVEAGDLFSAGPVLLPAFGVSILIGVMVLMGFCLLVIPGIIVALMFSQSILLVLDGRVGVIDSLRMSMAATSGNKLTLFALYLLTMFVGVAATVLTCGLGLFFIQPFWMLLWCVSYLTMTGQSTVDDVTVSP